jgi:hypothetical protein
MNNVLPAEFSLHVMVSLSERGHRPKSFPARDHPVGAKALHDPSLHFVRSPLEHRLKIDFPNRFSYCTIQITQYSATTGQIGAFKITQNGCHCRLNYTVVTYTKSKRSALGAIILFTRL